MKESNTSKLQKHLLFFGMSRGGSSITFQILSKALTGVPKADIEGDRYRASLRGDSSRLNNSIEDELAEQLKSSNYSLFGPFRNTKPSLVDIVFESLALGSAQVVVVTRDPIDCLYSWFWARHLHENWANGTFDSVSDVDNFCLLLAKEYLQEVQGLINFSKCDNCISFRYEDIINVPEYWLRDVLNFCDFIPTKDIVAQACNFMAFSNLTTSVSQHRRSGKAGVARLHLKPETINAIDEIFFDFNQCFSYPASLPSPSEEYLQTALSVTRDFLSILAKENASRKGEISDLKNEILEVKKLINSLKL